MIDLHSHILAAIDDGASNLTDAIDMIKQASNSGVTKILATPHINSGTFDNDILSINNAFVKLTKKLDDTKIPISIAYSAEVRISPEIMLLVKNNKLPFMGKWQEMNVLLLEFSHSHIPPGSEKLIEWLIKKNIKPMIAHPERNRDLWKFPELLKPLSERPKEGSGASGIPPKPQSSI